MAVISRLLQDEKEDWSDELNSVVWIYKTCYGREVCLYTMYADDDLASVVTRAERYMGVNA